MKREKIREICRLKKETVGAIGGGKNELGANDFELAAIRRADQSSDKRIGRGVLNKLEYLCATPLRTFLSYSRSLARYLVDYPGLINSSRVIFIFCRGGHCRQGPFVSADAR